jgi:hypothetical protein
VCGLLTAAWAVLCLTNNTCCQHCNRLIVRIADGHLTLYADTFTMTYTYW